MKKSTTWFFAFSCFGAILFLFLPLILRLSCVYDCFDRFLSVFRNVEYKSIYIETLGALYGAFLGVTGAVWAQNLANTQSKSAETERNAQVLSADLKDSVERVKNIVCPFLPHWNPLHADNPSLQRFDQLVNENRIVVLPDWKQMVLSVEQSIGSEELRLLLITYTKLSEISSLSSSSDKDNITRSTLYTLLNSVYIKLSELEALQKELNAASNRKNSKKKENKK